MVFPLDFEHISLSLIIFLLTLLLLYIYRNERKVLQSDLRPINFLREVQLLELISMLDRINNFNKTFFLKVECKIDGDDVVYFLTFEDLEKGEKVKIEWGRYADYVDIKKILHDIIINRASLNLPEIRKKLSRLVR